MPPPMVSPSPSRAALSRPSRSEARRGVVRGTERSAPYPYLPNAGSLSRAAASEALGPPRFGGGHPAPLFGGLGDERWQRCGLAVLVDRDEHQIGRRDVHDVPGEEVLRLH